MNVHGLAESCGIPEIALENVLWELDEGYLPNPYVRRNNQFNYNKIYIILII